MFQLLSFTVFCCLMHQGIPSFIVPDEVPSLLSLVYSNIPPIKKGTDSRFGWGFSLGDHADFQVLVELGPQTNTKPLGNEGDKSNKRDAPNSLRNTLYAQTQLLKKLQQQQQEASKSDGGKWLQAWSNAMQKKPNPESMVVEGVGEVDASKVIPAELEELYGANRKRTKSLSLTTKTLSGGVLEELYNANPKDAVKNRTDFTTSKGPVVEKPSKTLSGGVLKEQYNADPKSIVKSRTASTISKDPLVEKPSKTTSGGILDELYNASPKEVVRSKTVSTTSKDLVVERPSEIISGDTLEQLYSPSLKDMVKGRTVSTTSKGLVTENPSKTLPGGILEELYNAGLKYMVKGKTATTSKDPVAESGAIRSSPAELEELFGPNLKKVVAPLKKQPKGPVVDESGTANASGVISTNLDSINQKNSELVELGTTPASTASTEIKKTS